MFDLIRIATRSVTFVAVVLSLAGVVPGQATLIQNVRIFNGVDLVLTPGHVLVDEGVIQQVSSNPIPPPAGATLIDGQNRVLTPGFIDLHAHLTLQYQIPEQYYDTTVAGAFAAEAARFYLNSGFTTVRDAGGTHPDFARVIDSGRLYGPRVFPSGAIITQTSGHGDLRLPAEPHPVLEMGSSPYMRHRAAVLADGVDQTLMAVRENLKAGATQIKIMGGGGVMSTFDPIHTLQPSPEEIRAAVQAASDWGTYILAHSYTSEAVQRLIENGVRSIEHGLLIDDATAKMAAEKGVVISTQLMVFRTAQDLPGISRNNLQKLNQVLAGQENLIRLIKKYNITTGFGTDFVFGDYNLISSEFTARANYWTPAEVLKQATSESAKVIRMAGKLNRHGNFGEIREGWVADLLLINGEPFDDISILEKPEESLAMIMKAGKIMK